LLLGPVGPAQAGPDGLVTGLDGSRWRIGDGPFVPESTSDDLAVYQAREVDSNGPGAKIRRIREHRLPDANHALGALVRDEVSLIERIPPDRAAALAKAKGIKVGVYEHPSIHLIALDGRNPVLRNRTLRRGLSYAIDRKGLLEETLLRRAIDGNNAQADGPFARGSYADAPGVKPLEHDPGLARALVRAAQIEMGDGPLKLTFEYPRTPEALVVAPRLAEAFRALGIELRTVERPETDLEQELRAGRRFDLAYRSGRWTEPAWDAGPTICPGYDAPTSAGALGSIASARTLQVLLQLERAAQWPEARALVVQLDRESRDELPVIPLWQLDDHYAWRDRLNGPGETAEHLYQKIETWTINPISEQ
jgi:peptide/nickel transport system substrate-binding protein